MRPVNALICVVPRFAQAIECVIIHLVVSFQHDFRDSAVNKKFAIVFFREVIGINGQRGRPDYRHAPVRISRIKIAEVDYIFRFNRERALTRNAVFVAENKLFLVGFNTDPIGTQYPNLRNFRFFVIAVSDQIPERFAGQIFIGLSVFKQLVGCHPWIDFSQ